MSNEHAPGIEALISRVEEVKVEAEAFAQTLPESEWKSFNKIAVDKLEEIASALGALAYRLNEADFIEAG